MPMDPSSPSEAPSPADAMKERFGLTGIAAEPPRRVPIRTRSMNVTHSGWRLEVRCDQGPGAVILAETSPGESYHRGEGLFLGWPQDTLAALYEALRPRADDASFETPQLG
jgi:hypothetical protein